MNNHSEPQQAPSIGLDDAVYLLFRHKWKIMFFTLLGLAAAAAIYLTDKTVYRSQAKLLVRYITEKRSIFEPGSREAETVRPLDPHEASVMAAEAEILRSNDSVVDAIKAIGANRVLQAYGGGTNLDDAARVVMRNLQVDIGKSAGVMFITQGHREQDIAQRLLTEIINQYLRKHNEIHHSGATYDQIQEQTEGIRQRLLRTDSELRAEKRKVNITNLEQTRTDLALTMSDLRRSIFQTEAELAQARAQLEERRGSGTNEVAQANSTTNAPATLPPTRADVARYNQLANRLMRLREYEAELLNTFSESSKKVQQARQQITELQGQLDQIPIDPAYLTPQPGSVSPSGHTLPPFDWEGARAQIAALEAKYGTLTNRLAKVREESVRIEAVESNIAQLERQKKMEEEEYAYYVKSLEEVRVEQVLDLTRRNNINVIQQATSIAEDPTKLLKKAGTAAVGGILVGLLLAFLSDFVFNTSVKRAKDLETSIRLPVIAAVPNFGRKLKAKRSRRNSSAVQKNGHSLHLNGEIAPWEDTDPMLPYYEALRDRVVMSYKGDDHKPKVVGLTSCNPGAGVSRLATGLAAALSRDAQRNILLVGLQRNKVSVSAFAKGRPTDGIEAPEHNDSSEKQLVAQNLYSLATTGRNLAGASVVQSFSELLPKLEICDYDYIVFDLPPLTQTSGSIRLASQMERTVLVVEAEETSKEKVKKAKALLKANQAHLYAVLNKTKSYGPKSLRDDI